MLKVLTVVGARPQFIKAAAMSRIFNKDFSDQIEESIVHTGQHFDQNMSEVFFCELGIPEPLVTFETRNGSHGVSTGKMMADLDKVIIENRPDLVLVFGDTNSTIAAALSASKLDIPVAHVEAGMRSWNRSMPEEINRVVTDHVSSLNLAASDAALRNLQAEGLGGTAHVVGDIMFDSLRIFSELRPADEFLDNIFGSNHENSKYIVATFHRQQNLEEIGRLNGIVQGLNLVSEYYPVVIPMHPRLRSTLTRNGLLLRLSEKVKVIDPVSYVQMLALLRFAAAVITDSGGLQKEAFFLRVPCVTVRDETEWLETVALGWNRMTNAKSADILRNALEAVGSAGQEGTPYGSGDSAKKIAELIISFSAQKG